MASSAEERLRAQFLDHQVCVWLRDDTRAFCGTLVCIDRHGNAILNEVVEQQMETASARIQSERLVPMVMIPGKWISRFYVLKVPPIDPLAEQDKQKQYLNDSTYL